MTVRLDEMRARNVAEAFASTPSAPGDPLVSAAYSALERESDSLFRRLTDGRPGGFEVVFTECLRPYDCDAEMIVAARETRQLQVVASKLDRERRHPWFSTRFGGSYDRFRAVHDLMGHVGPGLGFDRHGEYEAWLRQARFHSAWARAALATELHGEHSVTWTTGNPPEHKALLLGSALAQRRPSGRRTAMGE